VTATLWVLGDSVPHGERTSAAAWPDRLDGVTAVERSAETGVSLASLSERVVNGDDSLDGGGRDRGERERRVDETVVLVHAGHNDAQLSGGEPRVSKTAFRDAAADLDAFLASHERVDRHAFVGLVPLLRLDGGRGVPFDERQPERSLAYDDALADAVETHLAVARPVDEWFGRTADGVHPNDAGHAYVAEPVTAWLTGER
jgi:lysophospholipase L1-like esterase